jgi:hypothetical protein
MSLLDPKATIATDSFADPCSSQTVAVVTGYDDVDYK